MELHGPTVDAAVAKSTLARLPAATRARLLATAIPLDLPPGARLYEAGGPARVALLVSGLIRTYRTLADGRQLTFLYDHAGFIPGLIPAFLPGPSVGTGEAVTRSSLLLLPPTTLKDLLRDGGDTALVLAEEFAIRAGQAVEEVTDHISGPLRERVGHHLLAIVSAVPRTPLVATVTQQALADATGAARESVTRVLRDLEKAGVIRMATGRIEVLDPDALCVGSAGRPIEMIS